jgi:hypothetical protein
MATRSTSWCERCNQTVETERNRAGARSIRCRRWREAQQLSCPRPPSHVRHRRPGAGQDGNDQAFPRDSGRGTRDRSGLDSGRFVGGNPARDPALLTIAKSRFFEVASSLGSEGTDGKKALRIYVNRGRCAHFLGTIDGASSLEGGAPQNTHEATELALAENRAHGLHDIVRRSPNKYGYGFSVFRFDGARYRLSQPRRGH